ncbi:MAG: ribonuclease P protein component 4 [Promethearchaeota archaeon]
MPKAKKINKGLIKLIARTRMLYLYELAHEIFLSDKQLANRYADLAKKYSNRAKIKIPIEWKKRTCHHCKKFLYPGLNCRTRLHSKGKGSHVSMTCLECNQVTRYYIKNRR